MTGNAIRARHLKKLRGVSDSIWVTSLDCDDQKDADIITAMPRSKKILLENLLRHQNQGIVSDEDIREFISGKANCVLFHPARVLLQDMLGVPVLVDLTALREAVTDAGGDPKVVTPRIPLDFVIDHSLMADEGGHTDARRMNETIEFERNRERFSFLRWCDESFDNLRVIPPDKGISHQLNLEYLAKVVWTDTIEESVLAFPDTVIGTDSHTPMINGLGVLGWGVGGIEAEAAMLGQPISIAMPRIVGVNLVGALSEGITATDLVLTLTKILREKGVVGSFVEFYGESIEKLSLTTRATIANMAPEYGATCVYFPIDDKTLDYLELTGRSKHQVDLIEAYAKHLGLWNEPGSVIPDFEQTIEVRLDQIQISLSGPSRPYDLVRLKNLPQSFNNFLKNIRTSFIPNVPSTPIEGLDHQFIDGDIGIAAIVSCTNTSNPEVMITAGLLAKRAVELGLKKKVWIKTTLAPGSKVVGEYLSTSGLQPFLNQLGFQIIGYGCTTCNGLSGPLSLAISKAIRTGEHIAVSVLSGNRNFQARIHPEIKANYLASPPLVIAYTLVGNISHDMNNEPLGYDSNGNSIYLKDIWPSDIEIKTLVDQIITPDVFRNSYESINQGSKQWEVLPTCADERYPWDAESTYLKKPPYFKDLSLEPKSTSELKNLRCLALLGDMITTDHISPSGAISTNSAAGRYLAEKGVSYSDFNSFGLRRGNHEVGMRSAFANIQLRNSLVAGKVGSYTRLMPEGEVMSIFDAAMVYKARGEDLLVIAGDEYGAGSSRDMAAKALQLIGVKAVVSVGFERIHRTNLIGMGILPLQFIQKGILKSLQLDGSELFDINFRDNQITAGNKATMTITGESEKSIIIELIIRIDTAAEVAYYQHGGILPFVYRKLIAINHPIGEK
jgi:aconitate hydratase